jgi:hypothetical protein
MAYYLVELVVFEKKKDHIYDKSIRHQCLQEKKSPQCRIAFARRIAYSFLPQLPEPA